MEQDYQTVLTSWAPKTSRNNKTYWEMTFEGGQLLQSTKASCWNQAMAQRAMGLYGQQVNVRLRENNGYLNVEEIAPAGEQLPPMTAQGGMPLGGGMPQQQAALPAAGGAVAMPQQPLGNPNAAEEERQERIARQAAQRTAAILLAPLFAQAKVGIEDLESVEEVHIELAKRLYVAANPSNDQGQAQIVPTAETPAEVAEQVNAAAGAEVVQQGVTPPADQQTPSWA